MNTVKRNPAVEICSSLLILLFAYTSISKYLNIGSFRFVLHESPLIHKGAGVIAWLLPAAELLIVLLLIIPKFRITGLKISLVALVLFTSYLIYMVLFAEHLPCSCGGVISKMSWGQHIIFNLFFIGIAFVGIKVMKRVPINKAIT